MISVIIPVLDEAENLPRVFAALDAEQTPHEVIVVDGGSRDGTAEVARRLGATVLSSPPGRGNQICRGVSEASGDVLFFLHADSVLPADALRRIAEKLAGRPELIGGNFRVEFDGETRFSRGLTRMYGFVRWFGLYYGDFRHLCPAFGLRRHRRRAPDSRDGRL